MSVQSTGGIVAHWLIYSWFLFLADNTNGDEFPELSRLLLDPERSQNLRLPNIFSFLPYLLNNPLSTVPAFVAGQGKIHGTSLCYDNSVEHFNIFILFFPAWFSFFLTASIVLGVPTVKRESQSYLLPTLASLIASMNEEEKNDTLIIVFIAEVELILFFVHALWLYSSIRKCFETFSAILRYQVVMKKKRRSKVNCPNMKDSRKSYQSLWNNIFRCVPVYCKHRILLSFLNWHIADGHWVRHGDSRED